jgi:DUF1009 family protein
MNRVVGIIAGNGLLPASVAASLTKQNSKCYIAALTGEADPGLYQQYSHRFFSLGMAGSIIEYFNTSNVEHVVLAGGVNRPNLKSLKVDMTGSILLARVLKQKFLGDDNLLKVITGFLEEKGFKIIASHEILASDNIIITTNIPSSSEIRDIDLGIKLLESIGEMDVGQSVIVEDGYILGIEAAEGTDNLIIRCSHLRKNARGGVLIKMAKRNQDTRVDMPTIGPETVEHLASYNYSGLAIKKDQVIVLNPQEVTRLANKYGLFCVEK